MKLTRVPCLCIRLLTGKLRTCTCDVYDTNQRLVDVYLSDVLHYVYLPPKSCNESCIRIQTIYDQEQTILTTAACGDCCWSNHATNQVFRRTAPLQRGALLTADTVMCAAINHNFNMEVPFSAVPGIKTNRFLQSPFQRLP